MNVDVTPDGTTIIFDLLGSIYAVPIDGGTAKSIRQDRAWNTNPRFSSDGSEIWFISDLDGGMRGLWAMPVSGGEARRVASFADRDIVGFATASDRAATFIERKGSVQLGESPLWLKHGNALPQSTKSDVTDQATGPVFMPGSTKTLFAQSEPFSGGSAYSRFTIFEFDPLAGTKRMLIKDGFSPRASGDGRLLAFYRGEKADLWIHDIASGAERLLYPNVGLPKLDARMGWNFQSAQGIMPSFAFEPSGKSIVLSSRGKLLRIDVATGHSKQIPFTAHVLKEIARPVQPKATIRSTFDARQLQWLNTDRRQKTGTFSAAGSIWIASLATGEARQITVGDKREFLPSISPNGKNVAFVHWSRGKAELKLVRARMKGDDARTLAEGSFLTKPVWSPDGNRLAAIRMETKSCADTLRLPLSLVSHCKELGPNRSVAVQNVLAIDTTDGSERILRTSLIRSPERLPSFAIPASMTYSGDGRRLFLIETDPTDGRQLILTSLSLANGSQDVLVRIADAGAISFATSSPNGQHIAITMDEAMWVLDIEGLDSSRATPLRDLMPRAQQVGLAGSSANWADNSTLIWSVGNHVFRWLQGSDNGRQMSTIRATVRNAAPDGLLALINATIVPMDRDRVIEKGTVIIDGARIVSVGSADDVVIPKAARILDVAGKTVLPGFIDTHAHPHLGRCCEFGLPTDQHNPYLASLAWGVTTVLDPQAGDEQLEVFAKAEMIAAGAMTGPRVYSSGLAIFGNFSGKQNGALTRQGIAAMCAVVHQRALSGALLIKSYRIERRDWRQRLVECARSEGIGATAEGAGDFDLQLTHFLDGHTATEHNLVGPIIYSDVAQFVGRSKIFYTPATPALYGKQEAVRYFGTRGGIDDDPRIRAFGYADLHSYSAVGGYVEDAKQAIYGVARSAQKIVAAGGKISLGSHGQFDGIGLHHDMWMLQLGGVEPFDLLRAATIWGAEKLGLSHDLGTIEPGKLADLVILDCNPLGDIRCSSKTNSVIKSGFVYDPETLNLIYPSITDHTPLVSENHK